MNEQQILQFKESAEILYNSEDYTSATILYFKSWFALQDFILLERIGRAPKDHGERFSLLEEEFPATYRKLDREFSTYRDTYSKKMDKETCDRIRGIVKDEIERHEIDGSKQENKGEASGSDS